MCDHGVVVKCFGLLHRTAIVKIPPREKNLFFIWSLCLRKTMENQRVVSMEKAYILIFLRKDRDNVYQSGPPYQSEILATSLSDIINIYSAVSLYQLD